MNLIATFIVVVTVLADASKELSAAEPATTQPQTIKGDSLQYSLSIPAGWEFKRNHEHFDIFTTAKNSGGNYWLGVYALPDAQGDTERWAELLTQGRFTGVFTRLKPVMIDSHQWATLSGPIQPGGITLTCRLYAYSEQGAAAYAIMLVTTPSAWPLHGAELLNIAQSFRPVFDSSKS